MRNNTIPEDTSAEPKIVLVPLDHPIMIGEKTITELQLRKPYAPELRGLNMRQVVNSDTDANMTLLTRVTVPPLAMHELARIDPSDLSVMFGELNSFFMTKAQKAAIRELLETSTT